jgi:hypothetical protein
VTGSARLVSGAFIGTALCFLLALSPVGRAAGPCGYAHGAGFNVSTNGEQFSGHLYSVYPTGVSCSVAVPWVVRLTKESPGLLQPDGQYVLRGPRGWSCEGKGLVGSPHTPPTVSGDCQETTTSTPESFAWQIGEEHISQ